MKIFVTGGTGFVGGEIVRQLHAGGHAIRILARTPNARVVQGLLCLNGPEVCAGNILDANSLEGALNGFDAIIHLVGIISEVGESTFENIHFRGTQNVVAAAQKAGVKRFIHMSALGTRPNAVSRYHKSKWAAEETVRQSGRQYTIFRPSLIYGPGDQFVNLFAKMIRLSAILPIMGNNHAKFQPVSVGAVATAFVKSLTEAKSIGQTFDLCGPETFTLPEILENILLVMGRKRLKLRVPPPLARCQAAFLEFLFPYLFRKAPPLNRDQLIMLQEGNLGDATPANELFTLNPTAFREGIARYLRK